MPSRDEDVEGGGGPLGEVEVGSVSLARDSVVE